MLINTYGNKLDPALGSVVKPHFSDISSLWISKHSAMYYENSLILASTAWISFTSNCETSVMALPIRPVNGKSETLLHIIIKLIKISHCLSIVELRPSSSLSTGCVVSLRGDWAIFCHAGSGRVGRVWSAREKSLKISCRGWELNPGHREDR